jgi:putative membrane protein
MGVFGSWWGLIMVMFWALIIGLVIWAVRDLWSRSSTQTRANNEDSAEETLKKRYARGEISLDEFEESLKVLRR